LCLLRLRASPRLAISLISFLISAERQRAMPHIKTFLRASGDELAWFLLTSSNLSCVACWLNWFVVFADSC
jgi:hypothetical protein